MRAILIIGLSVVVAMAGGSCPSTGGSCPNGWVQRGKSCYFASRHSLGTWSEAEVYCKSHGGNLADINDAEEDTFVRGLAVQTGGEFVWIGATDHNREGTWISSTTHQPLTYFGQWAPGQPDNWNWQEHCLCLWRNHRYLWNDGTCYHRHPFVCEKSSRP